MMMPTPGDRVGAVLSQENGVIKFLGYGVYLGNAAPFPHSLPFPQLLLDNGDLVWGSECWWGVEEKVRRAISEAREVVPVSIWDYRAARTARRG